MKQITGGDGPVLPPMGTRCVVYCCRISDNHCSDGIVIHTDGCVSHEQCQAEGGNSHECESGQYLAGLCKG